MYKRIDPLRQLQHWACCTCTTRPSATLLMCALGHDTLIDVYSPTPFDAPTPIQHNCKSLVIGTDALASIVVTSHPTTHTHGLVRLQISVPTVALVTLVANGQATHAMSMESLLHCGEPAKIFPLPLYTNPVGF